MRAEIEQAGADGFSYTSDRNDDWLTVEQPRSCRRDDPCGRHELGRDRDAVLRVLESGWLTGGSSAWGRGAGGRLPGAACRELLQRNRRCI